MDRASFRKLLTAVQQSAHPAPEQPTAVLLQSLQVGLSQSRLFAEVELGRTDDDDQMIIGVCRCADRVMPWEAGIGFERLWRMASASSNWESHHVGCTESLMEFEGAVTVDQSGHYITVHVVAEPAVAAEVDDARAEAGAEAGAEDRSPVAGSTVDA